MQTQPTSYCSTDSSSHSSNLLARLTFLLIGVGAYLGFHAVFLVMVSFLNGGPLPWGGPTPLTASVAAAIAINLGWVALFGIQHAVMARPWFKQASARVIPQALERSGYVIATVVCLSVAMVFWQTIPGVVFEIENGAARAALFALQGLGWAVVVLSTFLIDHFELFGLRQVFCAFREKEMPIQRFRMPLLYRFSRHPMMVGLFLGFWATPDMSFDRLLWATGFSLYILVGVRIEERDLVSHLGADYVRYQQQVPRFFGWA